MLKFKLDYHLLTYNGMYVLNCKMINLNSIYMNEKTIANSNPPAVRTIREIPHFFLSSSKKYLYPTVNRTSNEQIR